MTFLRKTPTCTKLEARNVCELHELIQWSMRLGPISLPDYAEIARVKSSSLDSWERSARRLVSELAELGYRVEARGDRQNLALDFSKDEGLRVEVERWIDMAHEVRTRGDGFEDDEDQDDQGSDVSQRLPLEALKADHRLGLDVRRLCRRFRIPKQRVTAILQALRVKAHPEGRPRIEARRGSMLIAEALGLNEFKTKDGRRGSPRYGRVTAVARLLGIHRDTARAFLRRLGGLVQGQDTGALDEQ